ncbi:VTT domain-containing protein [Propionibacteriaceae bacterium G1746]|uniref:VTT domain-containing protein n=1 Tax=Aestuariimicrobium sp. G57 TaxID=3418485 RepID=UPI003C1637B3
MTWRFWVELVSAIGYGMLSAIIPVFHSEAFIVAGAATKVLGAFPMSLGLAIGMTAGKMAMFWAVRHGKELRWFKRPSTADVEPGTWRARWRALGTRAAHLLDHPVWGKPVLLVSAMSGIPPFYPLVFVAGAGRINAWTFAALTLLGFFVRNFVLALATLGVVSLW